jgi:anti-sigma regulatory factor (Ser/Thr protein kinase)
MEEHTNMPNVNETGEQPKRRAVTAESMAAKQRDISVSEFFAKNRHLLGFDNPRKALLTAVKEAVDNSLDACEEAGIVPEIWVHIEATGPNRYKVGVQDNGPGISTGKVTAKTFQPVKKARSTLPTMVSNGYRTTPFRINSPIITMKCAAARVSRSSSKDVTNAGAAVWTNIWNRRPSPIHT